MSAFDIKTGQQYSREFAQKYARCPMNEAARKREINDLARLLAGCYLVEKNRDWSPLPAVEGREDASGMAQ